MSITKPHTVPKVIRDVFQQILAHPEFDEFIIDPKIIDWEDPDIKSSNWFDYSHLQEKYLDVFNNPLVDIKRERTLGTFPGEAGDASYEFRWLIGKLRRYFIWWLEKCEKDCSYIDLERVADFQKEYPDCAIVPLCELKEGEAWYYDSENTRPCIRTPRGLIILDTDVAHNEILNSNTDWTI